MVKVGRPFYEEETNQTNTPMRPKNSVVNAIIEKTLINLRVLSQVEVGDKLDFTPTGNFIIQKPSRWTLFYRTVFRLNRWETLTKIQETVNNAEMMEDHDDGTERERIRGTMKSSIHGLRNIQMTYEDDTLFKSSIEVLLERIEKRYKLSKEDML